MRTRRWVAGAGAGALLLLGGVSAGSLVAAQEPTVPTASQVETSQADEHDPSYTASIRVTEQEGLSETDEAAALQPLATITADEAAQTAVATAPGTSVVQVELDNENGWLVYSVELSDGSDVKVDAGNGAVLMTDSGDEQENDADDPAGEVEDDSGPENEGGDTSPSAP